MGFNEYQEEAASTAVYQHGFYPFLGLSEEVGEFVGLAAKEARGDDMLRRFGSSEGLRQACVKEAGDVLWQLAQCLTELGISLQEVADANIKKVKDRQARGVLKGAGDDR